jgi:hypothetical protein
MSPLFEADDIRCAFELLDLLLIVKLGNIYVIGSEDICRGTGVSSSNVNEPLLSIRGGLDDTSISTMPLDVAIAIIF